MRRFVTEALGVVCLVFVFITANLVEERNQYKLELEMESTSKQNYSGMLAACLNGRPLYDSLSKKALFTEKAVSVDLTPIRSKNGR